MTGDEERRDVAARLRELAAHPDPDGDVYCGNQADNHLCFCPRCGAEVVSDD